MEKTFKVSLYIRVSTDKQLEGDSLEEQESELKKFCGYKNYLIHKIHIERGQSAKDTKRPEYQLLVQDIKNKKINAVVVKKLDRLSRSLLDFEEFMKTAQENNVEFISLRENFDTTNAIGKAMLRVALVFAQLEREQTAERISDVMSYRASQGLYNGGLPPYGYDVINKELVPHRKEKKTIELIFYKFIDLKSTTLIEKELNSTGIQYRNGLWDKRTIQKILQNPVYIGKTRWNNKLFDGIHQPLIKKDIFDEVQNIFQKNRYISKGYKIPGWLKGILYCSDCGSPMSPNYTKKKNNKKYYYYRCLSTLNSITNKNCKNKYQNMEIIDKKVLAEIVSYADEKMLKNIKSNIAARNAVIVKKVNSLETENKEQEQKLSLVKAKKDKYLDSLISHDFKNQEREAINNRIEEFALEEKRIQGNIYRLLYELNQCKEDIISIDEFKEEIISLKLNQKNMSTKQLEEWLRKNVRKVIYTDDSIKIEFKILANGN
ncbi:MAG: recombinase family protein [Endomicrobiales bacterium]|nr:recombinase family protein [Endomicrobiales bacterium]